MSQGVSRFFDDLTERCSSFFPLRLCSTVRSVPETSSLRNNTTARPRVKPDATTSRVERFFLLASFPRQLNTLINIVDNEPVASAY